jgi:hypothetical protein
MATASPDKRKLFSSGRDALSVVAEPHGPWNWVFIGPDAEKLPLVDGGSGSIDEMRVCLATHTEYAVIFGLLRLSFGTDKLKRNKFVFIVASNEDQDIRGKAVKIGQQMSQRKQLEKAFIEFTPFQVVLQIKNPAELSLANIVPDIQKKVTVDGAHSRAAVDGDGLSADAIARHLEEERRLREAAATDAESEGEEAGGEEEEHPAEADHELEQEVQALSQVMARSSFTSQDVPEVQDEQAKMPETLPWSLDQVVPIRPDEMRYSQKGILLNKYKYDNVQQAVDALNAGEAI